MIRYSSFLLTLAWLTAILLLPGCTTPTADPDLNKPLQPLTAESSDLVDKFGKRVGEEMLRAFIENRYDGFVEFFTDDLRARVSQSDFQQLRSVGTLTGYEYLNVFRNPHSATYAWKVRFETTEHGKTVAFDSLFQIMLVKQDDDYQVGGCRFQ